MPTTSVGRLTREESPPNVASPVRPLSIALLCGGSYVSGQEIVALATARGLRERGHEVTCFVNGWNDGEYIRRLESLSLPYHQIFFGRISLTLRPKYLLWSMIAIRHLPKARELFGNCLRELNPDVVLAHNREWLLLGERQLAPYPKILHVHGIPTTTRRARCLYHKVDRSVTRYIAISNHVKRALVELGIPEKKVALVYNGVSSRLSRARGHTLRPVTIGIVGQIGEWKGHEDLISALELLLASGKEFRCVVFGTGDPQYIQQMKDRAARARLSEWICWAGFVNNRDEIFEAIDICVVPSRFEEPFGLVAAEAGLRGIPVVATNRGGLPEIVVDGVTGFLVSPNSPSQLAERITTLINDRALRERLGAAASQRVVENFGEECMTRQVASLCEDIATRQRNDHCRHSQREST